MHCSLDLCKYKLIRGLLENNLGEPIEDFMRPYDLQDPRIHVSETDSKFFQACSLGCWAPMWIFLQVCKEQKGKVVGQPVN